MHSMLDSAKQEKYTYLRKDFSAFFIAFWRIAQVGV